MKRSRHDGRAVLARLLQDNQAIPKAVRTLRAESSGDEVTVYLYDVIDSYWGVSAKQFALEVLALPDDATLNLRINSPGGDVFEARAMVSALQQFKGRIVTHIDGLAASAASYVALAADEVRMSDGAFMMIHNAWGLVIGNAADLRETADLLDKVDASIVSDYHRRTGKAEDEIAALMAAETWFTATEAKEFGFVDEIVGAERVEDAARWDVSAYAKAPRAVAAKTIEDEQESDDALIRARARLSIVERQPA
jgi:ATP-dependent Clp protease protease subunit